jgi:hypothetical protein
MISSSISSDRRFCDDLPDQIFEPVRNVSQKQLPSVFRTADNVAFAGINDIIFTFYMPGGNYTAAGGMAP